VADRDLFRPGSRHNRDQRLAVGPDAPAEVPIAELVGDWQWPVTTPEAGNAS
jgi:hypothetical protein